MDATWLRIDESFLTRTFLGALSEHEQRWLVSRLLARDERFRAEFLRTLPAFEMFDLDLVAEYDGALQRGDDPAGRRWEILRRARRRAGNFEDLVQALSFDDFPVGTTAGRLFTWSLAELLLEKADKPGVDHPTAATSLFLARLVIDVVGILGAAGHSPHFPRVVADLQRRLEAAEGRRH